LLYTSGRNKEIADEAEIKFASLMTLSEAIPTLYSSLFLTEDKLPGYSNGRDSNKMMVFELGGVRQYSTKAPGHGLTMVGEHVTEEEYDAPERDLN